MGCGIQVFHTIAHWNSNQIVLAGVLREQCLPLPPSKKKYLMLNTPYKAMLYYQLRLFVGAVVSKIMPVSVNSEGYIVSQLNHNHNFHISVTSPYKW